MLPFWEEYYIHSALLPRKQVFLLVTLLDCVLLRICFSECVLCSYCHDKTWGCWDFVEVLVQSVLVCLASVSLSLMNLFNLQFLWPCHLIALAKSLSKWIYLMSSFRMEEQYLQEITVLMYNICFSRNLWHLTHSWS